MAIEISALPAASALTGAEEVPVVQGGVTKRTTAGALSGVNSSTTRTVHVTAAELLDAFANPITIVPPPGAGKTLIPLAFGMHYHYGTAYYDSQNVGANFYLGTRNLGGDFIWQGRAQDIDALMLPGALTISSLDTTIDNTAITWKPNSPLNDTGEITAREVDNPGTGYAPGDTFYIDPDETALEMVDTVDGSGGVLTFHTVTPGTSQIGVQTTANDVGSGVGLTINVTAIALGDGSMDLAVTYAVF